jgi:AraC family transcriptional regulator
MTHHVLNCELRLFADREPASTTEAENRDDVFVISTPLSLGSARLESNGRLLYDGDVRPGMLRVMSPGERVRLTRRIAGGGAVIDVAGAWFRQLADAQRHRGGFDELGLVRPVLEADRHIERLRGSLLGVADVDPAQRPMYVEGLVLMLLSLVLDRRDARDGVRGHGLSDRQLAQCIEYADSRIAAHLDLDTWAAVLDMPTGEFVRRFQRTTHSAPYAWFLDWRIDRAKQLMTDPQRTLVAIALEVGFSSQSHFTEAFRRRVGMSPGRWRKTLRDVH